MVRVENKVNFIHVPKTGGSSVTKFLQSKFQWEALNRINGIPAAHVYTRYIDLKDLPSFIFVREPLGWFESLYKMLCSMNHRQARAFGFDPNSLAGLMFDRDFPTFIENILRQAPDFYNEVLERYYIEGMIVGRTENIDTELFTILKSVGIEVEPQPIRRVGVRNAKLEWGETQKERILEKNKYYQDIISHTTL